MINATYSLSPTFTTASHIRITGLESVVTNEDRFSRNRPVSIPASQLYYWTREWQDAEAEALAELDRGEGQVFESGHDAVKWLLADDD